jgi:hypothetical protein
MFDLDGRCQHQDVGLSGRQIHRGFGAVESRDRGVPLPGRELLASFLI